MTHEFLIVGAGLTGATVARILKDAGRRVLVVDRRSHVAGNCFDFEHETGFLVNAHGPHYFRTNSEIIWDFIQRFAQWRPWAAEVTSYLHGRYNPWPPQAVVGWIDSLESQHPPCNFEEAALRKMPVADYNAFVYGYTRKQWGIEPLELSAALAVRLELRPHDCTDRRLKLSKYQALPVGGYTKFVQRILNGIDVVLRYTATSTSIAGCTIIWTGPIDEFFNFRLGKLKYRGQKRTEFYLHDKVGFFHPTVQTNYPDVSRACIRDIEWKHMAEASGRAIAPGTLVTRETPYTPTDPNDYEYPFPDAANAALYQQYVELSVTEAPNVIFAGRLGRYKYLDMDHAIGAALKLADGILRREAAVAA